MWPRCASVVTFLQGPVPSGTPPPSMAQLPTSTISSTTYLSSQTVNSSVQLQTWLRPLCRVGLCRLLLEPLLEGHTLQHGTQDRGAHCTLHTATWNTRGADVALRLMASSARSTLGFSLSPQAGEVSRSRSHSVSRSGPLTSSKVTHLSTSDHLGGKSRVVNFE